MRFFHCHTHLLLVATLVGWTTASLAIGQPASGASAAVELARAEQFYDQANYRQAARILEHILNDSQAPGSLRESAAATRLLAQVYHRSADYARAAQMGERHARLTRQADAETELILADSYLALKRYDEAARHIKQFHAAFVDSEIRDLRQAKLAMEGQRIAARLRSESPPPADVATQQQPVFDSAATIASVPERAQSPQRFQTVMFTVERLVGANQIDDAIALLTDEQTSPAFNAHERTELQLQLADCYRRRATISEEAGDEAARRAATEKQREVLAQLSADLTRRHNEIATHDSAAARQFTRAERFQAFANLLIQEATLAEMTAQFVRVQSSLAMASAAEAPDGTMSVSSSANSVEQDLRRAEALYRQLWKVARELDRTADSDPSSATGISDPSAPTGRASQYRDASLCGLQRVYDAMRSTAAERSSQELTAKLCRVSDALVAERTARLLPTDPSLYSAKRAQASVYASHDDQANRDRAADMYRELVAFWDANPSTDTQSQAAALIGLAEMLRAQDRTREAYSFAQRARELVAEPPAENDAASHREHALLAARIDNSLAVTSIALGQYRDALQYLLDADRRLKPYGQSAFELRRKNHDALHVLSRVRVYRGLLHKAEAQYHDAAARVREGRELRERLNDDADLLAYHLAEASVHLAQAHALVQEGSQTANNAPVRDALQAADAALDRAQPLADVDRETNEPRQMAAALPYRYLRALWSRLHGDRDESRQAFERLAEESQQYGDQKTAAKCFIQLARLAAESISHAPTSESTSTSIDGSTELSRAAIEELWTNKQQRRASLAEAAGYAAQAVALFQSMEDRELDSDNEEAVTALPSLHFQAAYLAARLHVLLAALDNHILQLNELLATGDATSPLGLRPGSAEAAEIDPATHRRLAIDYLEVAVAQAERPASSTTQERLQRAKFFSRYAPAYDLLVDLLVARALDEGDQFQAHPASPSFGELRRAVEIADRARNRTFREQIDGWRESQGAGPVSQAFDWDRNIGRLAAPGTAILVYHLDGPQMIDGGSGSNGSGRIGGGHLFAIFDRGQEIQYFRLQHTAPDAAEPSDLTRQTAADLVRRHVAWMERPHDTPDWGRRQQRALTEAILPRKLLEQLNNSPGSGSGPPIRRMLVIADGALHQLPFESLLLPEGFAASREIRYVLDELPPVCYGPSLSVLAAISRSAAQGGGALPRLLTVGNPAYPVPARQTEMSGWGELLRQIPDHRAGFPPLPHSEQECESVYDSFDELPDDQRTRLIGARATEAAVRKGLTSSRFIHLAVHGCVDYQNDNLFGALVVAPGDNPSDPQDDGIFQLRDIYGLNLASCELAVLSACQSYVGPARPLEAGTSMARAFLEQGARRVVCSQWNADDEATTELMTVFFNSVRRARQSGEEIDYALALHEAKRALRAHSDHRSMPRYWSPFILVGAP